MTKTTMKKATDEPDAVTDQPDVGSPAMIGPHRAVAVYAAQGALAVYMRDVAGEVSAQRLSEHRAGLVLGLMPLLKTHRKLLDCDMAAADTIGAAALMAATMAYADAAMRTLSPSRLQAPAAAAHGKALAACEEALEWALEHLSIAHRVSQPEGGAA